ncbi:reverse transcriptase [Plakobranchus ocellatus]|uniref:Reverse transcriptase n=1 Tax=Plakobranchus ocellatus TaxID=259542 RepID=A0AAV3Y8I2_9GAST|nr:reverse transcriptase [Plakobranchus ocellatus]
MLATFKAKQHKMWAPPRKSRKQCKMEMLHTHERNMKMKMKTMPVEQTGLQTLWEDLKARHLTESRAEYARKREIQKKKTQEDFFKYRSSSPNSN